MERKKIEGVGEKRSSWWMLVLEKVKRNIIWNRCGEVIKKIRRFFVEDKGREEKIGSRSDRCEMEVSKWELVFNIF